MKKIITSKSLTFLKSIPVDLHLSLSVMFCAHETSFKPLLIQQQFDDHFTCTFFVWFLLLCVLWNVIQN